MKKQKALIKVSVVDDMNETLTAKTFHDICVHHGSGWSTTKPVTIYIEYFDIKGCISSRDSAFFEVPANTWWDGASIPKLFQQLIGDPLDPEFCLASFVHDYLYGKRYDRLLSDDVFLKLLEETKFKDIPAWKEKAMYSAVRVGGQAFYAVASDPKNFKDKVGKLGWQVVLSVL
jgi:hypothetical protein